MPLTPLESNEFVRSVQPMLERQDVSGLLNLLKTRWNCEQLTLLAESGSPDAKKVAALALGLVGTGCCTEVVARLLRDPDPMVNRMAEHALWTIWFRNGKPEANHQLCRGAQALDRGEFEHAVRHFNRAVSIDPDFAEGYNQRALAYYFLDDFESSLRDCDAAIERMPCHFGAWSGRGHCYAHLGRMHEALQAYQVALEINPHLECIRESVEELQRRLGD